jgi:diguanylate cyclase (GGDEF)-like protein
MRHAIAPASSLDRFAASHPRSGRVMPVAASLLALAVIGLLDYVSGRDLFVSILYLGPVVACAWWTGRRRGLAVAAAALLVWSLIDRLENPAVLPGIALANAMVRGLMLLLAAQIVSRLRRSIVREQQLARTDALTGAANGRTFYQAAAGEVVRARRNRGPITLAYIDLDNFKQLNDRFGHAAGDAALIQAVEAMQLSLRSSDLLARLGGDEFALLLPDTGAKGARGLLTRLQRLVADEMDCHGWPVTLSIGAITFLEPRWDIDVMIHEVDALMFDAKRKGKGRVEHTVVSGATTPRGRLEKRVTTRVLCNAQARVRPQGEDDLGEEFATISDLSDTGVGIHLDAPMPPDTVLIIEGMAPGLQTLLARVVHVSPTKRGWLHGCELSTRLDEAELRSWVSAEPAAELAMF